MKQFFAALAAVLGITCSATAIAAGPPVHVVMAGQEQWTKADNMGTQVAVLSGDPGKPGPYIVKIKTGTNWKFPVHTHPQRENVTILSGTFYAAIGSTWDASKLKAFPAGSFVSIPPNVPHYAMTKEPAVIEIVGMGPMKNVMVKQNNMASKRKQ